MKRAGSCRHRSEIDQRVCVSGPTEVEQTSGNNSAMQQDAIGDVRQVDTKRHDKTQVDTTILDDMIQNNTMLHNAI